MVYGPRWLLFLFLEHGSLQAILRIAIYGVLMTAIHWRPRYGPVGFMSGLLAVFVVGVCEIDLFLASFLRSIYVEDELVHRVTAIYGLLIAAHACVFCVAAYRKGRKWWSTALIVTYALALVGLVVLIAGVSLEHAINGLLWSETMLIPELVLLMLLPCILTLYLFLFVRRKNERADKTTRRRYLISSAITFLYLAWLMLQGTVTVVIFQYNGLMADRWHVAFFGEFLVGAALPLILYLVYYRFRGSARANGEASLRRSL